MECARALAEHVLRFSGDTVCSLRGTQMLEVLLCPCQVCSFDKEGHKLHGLGFKQLVGNTLRKQVTEAFVAVGRLMELGGDDSDRGTVHLGVWTNVLLGLEDDLENGLIDGKWGLPEGISIAVGMGYLPHMDNKNDSVQGWDKTGVISVTFWVGGQQRRLSIIGYTRHTVNNLMRKRAAGPPASPVPMKNHNKRGAAQHEEIQPWPALTQDAWVSVVAAVVYAWCTLRTLGQGEYPRKAPWSLDLVRWTSTPPLGNGVDTWIQKAEESNLVCYTHQVV